ncbi:MAG: AbrB family transcriptional regulator [Candidatus Kapabacteria bacterium]|nr:AbrB family transcriptional regulator [Candidatus Kapabacteria bacterium]
MSYVTVNSDYKIEIPTDIIKSINALPGQKFQVLKFNNRIEIIKVKPLSEARGFLEGIETDVPREADRI